MKILNKIMKFIAILLIILLQFVLIPRSHIAYAATSPTLGDAGSFSILAKTLISDADVLDLTTITGDVGLDNAGSNYSGLTTVEVGGTIYDTNGTGPDGVTGNNPALMTSARNANIAAYGELSAGDNATCTTIPVELSGQTLVPGVYCSGGVFTLNGTLTLSGTTGTWIFQSTATLITSGTANVVGGDPCNVWWKVPSSATLGTNTSLIGNILALTSITINTGASLNGRAFAQNAAVTLNKNAISGPTCAAASTPTPTPGSSSSSGGSVSAPQKVCPNLNCVTPTILESRRVSPTSIFLSWGPYAGINTFNIRYGLENGKWLYSTTVTGFSTTINALPPNQPIWVLIAPTDNCSIGPCGVAQLVGGPGLPNTGFASRQNTIPWYFPVGIGVAMSGLLVLIQRKHI